MKLAHAEEKTSSHRAGRGHFEDWYRKHLVTGSDIDDAEKNPQNGMEEKQ